MTLVFVSNFLNHHQLSLCQSFEKRCEKFYFVATEDILSGGYLTAIETPFVVHYYLEEEKIFAQQLICDADVVIFGACPNELIALRMKQNKLSFVFSERFFKKGRWRRFIPSTRKHVMERVAKYKSSPMYVLAASAHLPRDVEILGFPREKCYRWGYFPEAVLHNTEKLFDKKKNNKKIHLLWVARLIPLKRPQMMISLARKLKDNGFDFRLDILGDGKMSAKLHKMILNYGLDNHVFMQGSCDHEDVIKYMEQSDVFYFTSNIREGWGVVLNEAMNSGCVVISCVDCGATNYLVEHGKNGFVFRRKKELYNLSVPLIDNFELRKKIGTQAYHTIQEQWNHEVAAERFFQIVKDIQETGSSKRYLNGPCSNHH